MSCWYSLIVYMPLKSKLEFQVLGVLAVAPQKEAAAIRLNQDPKLFKKAFPKVKASGVKLLEEQRKFAHHLLSELRMDPTVKTLSRLSDETRGPFALSCLTVKSFKGALEDEIERLYERYLS